jgi:2-methylcitrate dehydratase PrpD
VGTLSADLTAFAMEASVTDEVRERTRIAVADTMIAMLSGPALPAGRAAGAFLRRRRAKGGGTAQEFLAFGSATPEDAAFVNGTLAHADETDNTHQNARFHPGCSVTPAALVMAEVHDATVGALLDSVAIGYDVGAAVNLGIWSDLAARRAAMVVPQYTGGLFGSLGAAMRLARVSPETGAFAFSYAVQQAGGCQTFFAEPEHVEKAVVMGGLPGRSAIFSLELAEIGFPANRDPFEGPRGLYATFGGADSDPGATRARLELPGASVGETTTKRYPVGGPIQAACEAIERIVGYGKTYLPDSVLVEKARDRIGNVDNSAIDDISLQHVVALQLVTGRVDFAAIHRMTGIPAGVAELKQRVTLVGARELDVDQNGHGSTLIARVTLVTGTERRTETVVWPSGSPVNPIGWIDIEHKAHEVLGACGWSDEDAAAVVNAIRTSDEGLPSRTLIARLAELAKRPGEPPRQIHD